MSDAKPTCLFCRIAAREVPSHAVYEDERIYAFLDIGPIRPGHTQIVPKTHYDYFDQLPPDLAAHIVQTGQRLAKAMKAIYGVERVAFAFTGGDVAHAHAHVVPMHESTDITSRRYIAEERVTFRALPRPSPDEMASHAGQLALALKG